MALTLDIRGTEIIATVDDNGWFRATIHGVAARSETFEGLRAELMRLSKRAAVKLAVPFMLLRDGTACSGVLTGRHQANGNLLVQWADHRGSQQVTRYNSAGNIYTQPLTPEQLQEWAALSKARREANMARDAFIRTHRLHLDQIVDAAERAAEKAEA